MGWDSRAWDSGDVRVGLFGSTSWSILTREQQVIAGLLGFSMETWGPTAEGHSNGRGQPTWPAWTAAATLEGLCHTAAPPAHGGPAYAAAHASMPPPYGKRQHAIVTANPHGGGMEGHENEQPADYATHTQTAPYGNVAVGVMHPGHPMHAAPAIHAFTYPAGFDPSMHSLDGGAMQMQQPLRHMPCQQASLTSSFPYLPKMIPLGNEQPGVAAEPKAEARPPSPRRPPHPLTPCAPLTPSPLTPHPLTPHPLTPSPPHPLSPSPPLPLTPSLPPPWAAPPLLHAGPTLHHLPRLASLPGR
jgi:hypothetical protein